MNWKSISGKKIMPLFSINFVVIIMILCTLVIVYMNYYTSKKTIQEIQNIIQQYEYNKTGGEENYKIMLEIQNDQLNSYINDLSENNPDYIESIKNKINPNFKDSKILTTEEIEIIQNTSGILGEKNASYSIVEFSDFDCNHCKDFHNENNIGELLNDNQEWNYIFKNMTNKNNTNAQIASKYGKCIEIQGGNDLYFDFISDMFLNDDLESIKIFLDENNLSNEEIEKCINDESTTMSLEKEFGQGIYLGITKTPSFVLINNDSGEIHLIEGKIDQEKLLESMEEFTK